MSKREVPHTTLPGIALPDAALDQISAGFDADAYRQELSAYSDEVLDCRYKEAEEGLGNARAYMQDRFPEGNAELQGFIDYHQQMFEVLKSERARRKSLK